MKTSEFIKRVEELGYSYSIENRYIIVDGEKLKSLAIISLHSMNNAVIRTEDDDELGKVCFEYAQTPLEEREEEKKFYLQKIESFYDDYDAKYAFLNLDMDENTFFLDNAGQEYDCKTQFTQKEIDKIKEEQHTDLSEFKQIPVESVILMH